MRQEYQLEVKEKCKLRNFLTDAQIEEVQCGKLVALCEGYKPKLDDEVKGIVLMLPILKGG